MSKRAWIESALKKCLIILMSCTALMVACDRQWRAELGLTGYQVYKFSENGMYYLVRRNDSTVGTGRLGGTILRIGYNKKYVICELEPSYIVNGVRLPDEIHVIEIKSDYSKIINRSELMTNPEYHEIILVSPASLF